MVSNLNEAELDAKFDELRQQLFDNQSLFYNGDILKSMQELEQAKQVLQAKDKELEQAKQGLQAKDKELEQIKHELIAMHLSTSWKITRPLRKIKKFFRIEK